MRGRGTDQVERAQGVFLGAALGAAAGAAHESALDTAVLTMHAISAYYTGGVPDPARDLAARLAAWAQAGLPRPGGVPCGPPVVPPVVARALARPGFLDDPAGAARGVQGPKAENDVLVRALACAFTADPAAWAAACCEVTHSDARCAAAAAMLALLLRALTDRPAGARVPPDLAVAPAAAGRDRLAASPARRADYMARLVGSRDLAAPGEHETYVLEALACAMWAFRQLAKTPPDQRGAGFFAAALGQVAARGGDAGTNCLVAGAVLGAALGPSQLSSRLFCGTQGPVPEGPKLPENSPGAPGWSSWLFCEVEDFVTSAAGPAL